MNDNLLVQMDSLKQAEKNENLSYDEMQSLLAWETQHFQRRYRSWDLALSTEEMAKEEYCLKQIRCANCCQDHPAYVRSCFVYKKEREILEVKHKRNVSSLKARKIIGSTWEKTARPLLHRGQIQPIKTTNIEHLTQLEANDWPKFQEHQKKLYSAEF